MFPNPLNPGSDIQILVSWWTRLLKHGQWCIDFILHTISINFKSLKIYQTLWNSWNLIKEKTCAYPPPQREISKGRVFQNQPLPTWNWIKWDQSRDLIHLLTSLITSLPAANVSDTKSTKASVHLFIFKNTNLCYESVQKSFSESTFRGSGLLRLAVWTKGVWVVLSVTKSAIYQYFFEYRTLHSSPSSNAIKYWQQAMFGGA